MPKIVSILVLVFLVSPCARAQTTSKFPPNVLLIRREGLKPGARIDHERSEAAWTHALPRSHPQLALSSISGPDEIWFAAGYESFATMDQDRRSIRELERSAASRQRYSAQERDFVSSVRTVTCVLVPDMSYRPQFDMAGVRYFRVRVTHVRPGHDGEYRELRKIINADEYEKPGRDIHLAVYHVTTGEPTGTYIALFPVRTAAEWDQPSPAMRQFLGADFEKVTELLEKSVISYEDTLFEVSPAMSVPNQEWIQADPAFWRNAQQSSSRTADHGSPSRPKLPDSSEKR